MEHLKYLDEKNIAASLIYLTALKDIDHSKYYFTPSNEFQKSPLNKKQVKSRSKAKNAKKSRKINRKK
jgi:hypothetical protein